MTNSRPWLRYSLRSLFVLVTVVAIALGWIHSQMRWIQQRRDFRDARPHAWIRFAPTRNQTATTFLWMLGELEVGIWRADHLTDSELKEAMRLFPESSFRSDEEVP